jgi:hypothetical protein
MPIRHANWAMRLEGFLQKNAARPFQYGEWDCCLFVCSAIDAMTGTDPGWEFRGKYDSAKTARRFGKVEKIAETVTARYGMKEVQPGFAQRGDLVMIKRSWDRSLGIISVSGLITVVGEQGLILATRQDVVRAWRV